MAAAYEFSAAAANQLANLSQKRHGPDGSAIERLSSRIATNYDGNAAKVGAHGPRGTLFMISFCRLFGAIAFGIFVTWSGSAVAQVTAKPAVKSVAPKEEPPVSYLLASESEQANERRIQAALAKQVTHDWKDVPLKDVIAQLADECDITIALTKKIEDAGVKVDQPITQKVVKISLRSCLRLILGDLNLTYMVKDEVIKITTIEDAQAPENLNIRLYPVRDLVERVYEQSNAKSEFDFAPLIRLIQEIEPDSWPDGTGPGPVVGVENAACLVIRQSDKIHETIGQLRMTLRRVKAVQGIPPPPVNRYLPTMK